MASGFLGAFTSLIGGKPWSDLPSSFCYSIGEKIPLTYASVFQLFDGVNTNDKSKVSIFMFDKKNSNVSPSILAFHLECARSCLKNIRTIRHPYILRTLEGVEVGSGIYIATERVQPLATSDIPSDPIWGFYQIASALQFLHSDVKVVHGMICPYTVFVTTDESHWRLGGFDAVRPLSLGASVMSELSSVIRNHPLASSGFAPPMDTLSALGLDRWGLASLICWTYSKLKMKSSTSYISLSPETQIKEVPPKAQALCRELLQSSRSSQKPFNFKSIMDSNPLFSESTALQVLLFFDQINLKGNWEKESFFTTLPQVLTKVPAEIQHIQVLPQLTRQLDIYGHPNLLVPSILLIGDNLSANDTPDNQTIYSQKIVPVLLKLLECPDRAVRYSLLQHLPNFERFLTTANVESVIDPILLGFTDSSNILREITLKSMCMLIPKLKKTSTIDKCVRMMTRLAQNDPEGAIRTNAIICFAKLANSFNKEQAAKMLTTAFLGGLRDPFPPCRVAALQSLSVCVGNDIFQAVEVVTKLIPSVCQRAVDADLQVRSLAFMSLEVLLFHARAQLDLPQESQPGSPSRAETKQERDRGDGTSRGDRGDKGEGNVRDGSSSKSGWTGWALKKAIDFYGTKENGSMDALGEETPSGNLKTQPPSPPPSRPVEPKVPKLSGEEFYDADESGWGKEDEAWDDEFDSPDDFKPINIVDEDSLNSSKSSSISSIPMLAPPPSSSSHVVAQGIAKNVKSSNARSSNVKTSKTDIRDSIRAALEESVASQTGPPVKSDQLPTLTNNSANSSNSGISGSSLGMSSGMQKPTGIPSATPAPSKPSGSGLQPLKLGKPKAEVKESDDFWSAFGGKPNNLESENPKAQSLKKMLAVKRTQPKSQESDFL